MAEADAKFTIDLALEGAAESKDARAEIERLTTATQRATATVTKMQLAYRNLKVGGMQNSAQAKELKARIDGLKKSIGENQSKLLGMRGGLADVGKETAKFGKSAKDANSFARGLFTGIQAGGGPVAALTGQTAGLVSVLGKAGIAGAALAGVAAIVALDIVVIKATLDIAKMALTAADARRSETLALQGMTKAWVGWWGQVRAGKASDVQASIDGVVGSVTEGRGAVVGYAESLYRAGLRGGNLTAALEAVSLASSATNGAYTDTAKAMVIGSAMMGRSVQGVADTLKARFGPIVKQQMLALSTQIAKAREGFAALFRGIKVEPALKGLDNVLSALKAGSVESKAWSKIFESLFNPLFAGAEEGGNVLRKFVDKATILALRLAIAWESAQGAFQLRTAGLDLASKALRVFVPLATSGAIAMLQAAEITLNFAGSLYNLGRAAYYALDLLGSLATLDFKGIDKAAPEFLAGLKGIFTGGETAQAGSRMIEGLVAGIKSAQPALNKAVQDSASEANTAFKAKLDIHSPSRVWASFGRQLPAGAAIGVRAGTREFAASADALASVPEAQPRGGSTRRGAAPSSTTHITLGDIIIQGIPAGSPGAVTIPMGEIRTALASILEGLVIQRGGSLAHG